METNDRNDLFKDAVRMIMLLRDEKMYRMCFMEEWSFDKIFAFADGLSAGFAMHGDDRLKHCILHKITYVKNSETIRNYEGLTDREKTAKFYEYFMAHIKDAD
ncbi:MAG: hypothetical protein K6E19_11540 [Lachnospiraceae bacterium]|nr:hypothetical protein [Lachnospiraceae bacterium]